MRKYRFVNRAKPVAACPFCQTTMKLVAGEETRICTHLVRVDKRDTDYQWVFQGGDDNNNYTYPYRWNGGC